MILAALGLFALIAAGGLIAADRRCTWCHQHVPAWRAPDHFYTHHLNPQDD